MKKGFGWVVLLTCGCNSFEGLSVFAPQSPQAVGTSYGLSVSRCAKRNVALDCIGDDTLVKAVAALDNSSFTLRGGGFTIENSTFVFSNVARVETDLVAVAAGTTQLTLTVDTKQGGQFTLRRTLEARELADGGFVCTPYPCLTGLSRLPHQQLKVYSAQGTDSTGSKLIGEADDQASGGLTAAAPLRFDVGGSGPLAVYTTTPGEGRVEPIDEHLRAAVRPLVVQVAEPDDAQALFFARTLDDGHGRLLRPLATVDFEVQLGTRFDPPEPFARIDAWPVIALRDGGWSAVQPDQLYRERPDGGGISACRGQLPCTLDFHAAGESTWFIDAGTRTLRATFTAH